MILIKMFIQKMNVKNMKHSVFSTKFLSVVDDYPMARLTNWTNNTANEDIIGAPKMLNNYVAIELSLDSCNIVLFSIAACIVISLLFRFQFFYSFRSSSCCSFSILGDNEKFSLNFCYHLENYKRCNREKLNIAIEILREKKRTIR